MGWGMNKVEPQDLRVMIIGAHPDDPDITGGGLALNFVVRATVKLVSMCNGDKGACRVAGGARRAAVSGGAAVEDDLESTSTGFSITM